MDESLRKETEKLTRSWMRHDQAALRDYLIADVEDPRLNAQSIISRHCLVTAACGDRFKELMDQELRFGVTMNWLLNLVKRVSCTEEVPAVLHGFKHGAEDAEGMEIPAYVSRVWAGLPGTANGISVPNYIGNFLMSIRVEQGKARFSPEILDCFMSRWRQVLAAEARLQPGPSVLEAACGSANDYRFLDACGLARLIDYTGFDLCEKNVANARALFPQARFEVGNVFSIATSDQSFDHLFAHDLFEHLSPQGIETAVAEVCRVVRHGLCLSFFNMDEIPEHVVRPVEDYHWNTLSVERMRELFAQHGFAGQVVHIGSFLRWATGCDQMHNPNAYTFLLHR